MPQNSPQFHAMPSLPPGTWPLWTGVIGAPAIWAAQLQAVYVLSPPACTHGTRLMLHAVNLISLLLVIAFGFICLAYYRQKRDLLDEDDRTRFLASLGLFTSGVFITLILAQTIATSMLDPCMT